MSDRLRRSRFVDWQRGRTIAAALAATVIASLALARSLSTRIRAR